MGFKESQFDCLIENNALLGKEKRILSQSKLIRLAGNSIVVQVLESIFKQMDEINRSILTEESSEVNEIPVKVAVAI